MNELTDITILIPTHNRPKYLTRSLEYFSKFPGLNIVVCDSSSKKYSFASKYSIEYQHYKNKSWPEKLSLCLKRIKTKYMIFCADDDFLVIDSLIKAVKFLKNNSSYVSVQGRSISFKLVRNNLLIKPIYGYSKNWDISSPLASRRIMDIFRPYTPVFYSVQETKNMETLFSSIYKNKIVHYEPIEILLALYTCIKGKHKVLPLFFSAREEMSDSAGKITETMDQIMSDDKFKKQYDSFLKLASNWLIKEMPYKLSKDMAQSLIIKSFSSYVRDLKTSKSGKSPIHIQILKAIIPKKFSKNLISKLYDISQIMKIYFDRGYPFFINFKEKKDLLRIKYYVLKYPCIK